MKNSNRVPKYHPAFQFNTPYVKKQLPTSTLHSGNAYQRRVHMKDVTPIVENFDPKLFDDVIVSFRDGRYNVVDGQHRIVALKILNGGADCMVNCKVISGLTYEQEAKLYEELDACKKKLSFSDATRAKAEARDDKQIIDIQNTLRTYGIQLDFNASSRSGGTNKIVAARAILKSHSELGSKGFAQMIELTKGAWRGATDSLSMYIISGMTLFVKTYGDMIKTDYFIKKLSKVSPKEIIADGKADISTHDMGLKYARVIWGKYNYKAAKNVLEYRFRG